MGGRSIHGRSRRPLIGEVAKAGKAELNIPMYANAWLGQPGQDTPGQYPSGGPVARLLDVYHAVAPSLDLVAPDIYVDDFKGACALYARSGNPLFIPEARDRVGNLFWALGHHAAWAWSPFGVEDLDPDGQVAQAYELLTGMLPQLAEWQAAGKVKALLVVDGEKLEPASLGGYQITLPAGRLGSPAPRTTCRQTRAPPRRRRFIEHTCDVARHPAFRHRRQHGARRVSFRWCQWIAQFLIKFTCQAT